MSLHHLSLFTVHYHCPLENHGHHLFTARASRAHHRRPFPLFAPPDPARSGHGGPAEAESRARALRRHWRTGLAAGLYLTAAGIGTLGLVDFDVVDASNLQRQIIHSTKDIGRKKLDSAEEKLKALNPAINIVKHDTMLSSANALDILKDYDIVADGTDNFPTRYLVNDACVLLGKPNAYGSIFRFEGQASVFATEARPMLPLPLSRTAAAGPGAQLRRGRSAGHSARLGRRHPGHRGHQAHPRQRRTAHWPAAAGRRPQHALPRTEAAQESRVPGLRHPPHRDRS